MIGQILLMAAGVLVIGGLVLFAAMWTIVPVFWFAWELYHHARYTTKGLCPKCHKKGEFVTAPASQMYGPSQVKYLACPDGHPSIPIGNRHGAEWAGF
jgi:hypothetical protein